jgi:isoleucyl-tRNA synthetase
MFKPVSSKLDVVHMEESQLRFWRENAIFHKCEDLRQGGLEYVFYEGPPTANGKPGVHHVLARAFKDIFPRYKNMRGYHVIRRGGWDTHGLPVEIEVEKRLGFNHKYQIEEYGIDRFNELCRKSAFDYIQDWEKLTERIAYWVDLQSAYVTFTPDYIESVWWILKTFWERDLLYHGHKVVPYCPRCGTALSDHEVAQGYEDTSDPSVFVRFPLVNDPETSLLVWTTTPWTLLGNVAVAAHPEVDYVIVERDLPEGGKEKLILAKPLLEKVFRGEAVRVYETFKGTKLKGLHYKPLYTYLIPDKPAYTVVMEDYVTTEDGTGLVHTAPAFGAEDMLASQHHNLPVLMTVAEDGTFIPEVKPWRGVFVKDADPFIIQDLDERGLLYRSERITHTYPFCWRCKTPLLYYARGAWYIRTSQFKERLVTLNRQINWVPGHIQEGRFGNWLENNVDWALSRERYWGTPLPVWECPGCEHRICIGSRQELSELTGSDLSELDLHRPAVDEIQFPCPQCSTPMKRVPDLIDVWFDSGSMPYGQWHYPFENEDMFKKQYPADFICEAVDQTRGWFYSLHAISSLLFDRPCFKNVICLGLVLDANGEKMSKSKGNMLDPWAVIDVHGADALRWYLFTATPPGNERRFSVDLVGEVLRNFTLTLWNVYSFFVTYANLDHWKPLSPESSFARSSSPPTGEGESLPASRPSFWGENEDGGDGRGGLDAWLLSKLHALVRDVTTALETYDVPGATRPVQEFVDDLSKWYLRRSRRRFWKSEADEDKRSAYATLYEALVTLAKLLAPTMPFLAEELYQNLVRSAHPAAPESVHLAEWPMFNEDYIDEALNHDMSVVVKLASLGHAARKQAELKVRQPLEEAMFTLANSDEFRALDQYGNLLLDELNVKKVSLLHSAGEAVAYSLNPLPKQLGQKYKARMPAIRAALQALDPAPAALSFLDRRAVRVTVEGEFYDILPEDVEVRLSARQGLAVAADGAYLCALRTELTPELEAEGLAREFVRRVQELRKQADLDIADRIRLYVQATPRLAEAIVTHQEYIRGETLVVEMVTDQPVAGLTISEAEFDEEKVSFGIMKAGYLSNQ